jgi:hypothetical protein
MKTIISLSQVAVVSLLWNGAYKVLAVYTMLDEDAQWIWSC